MALPPLTPRDRLERLVDHGRKAMRRWWIVALFAVVGGALSVVFALTRPPAYTSSATLFYQQQIQSLLQGRDEGGARNVGDRYRELLLARGLLAQIATDKDPKANPFFAERDPEFAIDKLRLVIRFEGRGANAFRITFTDTDPDRAKAVVEKLTTLLADKDDALRNEQAKATASFATSQKDAAAAELQTREHALAEFLAQHPEFAQETGPAEGASIRAIKKKEPTVAAAGSPRLIALERQHTRIQARLAASGDSPVHTGAPSPERVAAEAAVHDAQREAAAAQRGLDEALGRYTDKHPSVVKAREALAAAEQRVAAAQAAVPTARDVVLPPTSPEARAALERELTQVEAQLADARRADKAADAVATPSPEDTTNWVVKLETAYADLRRAVDEQNKRVQALSDTVFRAQLDASQKLAEQGSRLSVVDPANRPAKPGGPGKSIFVLGGMVLFLGLGLAIAIGLAIIDDRLYRRSDLELLGIPVLAVIPPAIATQRKARKS
jgi:uncharacterized protein involved in exopolysaccharide biosynthesis